VSGGAWPAPSVTLGRPISPPSLCSVGEGGGSKNQLRKDEKGSRGAMPVAGSALQPAVPFPTGQPDECVPLSHGSTRSGNLKARLHQLHASERFSDHLACNGLEMRFSRVDMDERATRWNTLMRASPEQINARGSKSNFSLFSSPIVAIDGDAMNQSSHNTAFMCDSDGQVVAYGGRVGNRGGRDGPYGLHHGLLRWAGHATPNGVEWGPPLTVMNLDKARSLNCAEGRADWESCELDGKLSAVEFKGRAFLFARYNYAYGGRTVQVASAPKASPGVLSRFEAVELEGEARNTTNLYFASVRRSARGCPSATCTRAARVPHAKPRCAHPTHP
jgi:hypothetical protein